jgi:peptidyl-prolyl cis-trans isomerase B (cyclophilin B)
VSFERRALAWVALAVAAAVASPGHLEGASPAGKPGRAPDAVVETEAGSFVIRLFPDLAPGQVRYFLQTARSGGYDGTTFHRIVPGQVIQGGDPYSRDLAREPEYGRGGFGMVRAEVSKKAFTRGVVVAARCPTNPDSAGAQFFVVLADQPSLQGHYTVFGEVASGMEVADAIGEAGGDDGKPRRRVEMRVRLQGAGEPPTPQR